MSANATKSRPKPPPRIISRDPYSFQYEIWEADGVNGDVHEFVFYLPKGISAGVVEGAFRTKGRKWIEWRTRAHRMILNQKSLRCTGPHQALELDHLDENLYLISARWWREKPYKPKTLDEAHQLMTTMPSQSQPDSIAEIYAHGANNPDMVEPMARAKVAAAKLAPAARKSWGQMDSERRAAGLPEFKYQLEGSEDAR